MSDNGRKPMETPFEQTVPDIEQDVESDGLGEERLKEDVAETEVPTKTENQKVSGRVKKMHRST